MRRTKWSYFSLYVIIDIFSRRIVGCHIADAETATLFKPLIDDAVNKPDIPPGQLTLLADPGVTKSHRRPYTSNDNLFSKSCFKTLKYQPQFPKCFSCIEDAKTFCRHFFNWYNRDHHHASIGLMTPDQVHYGQARRHPCGPPEDPRSFLRHLLRTLRQKITQPTAQANRRLDQPAKTETGNQRTNLSLNSNTRCLIGIDTFRRPRFQPLGSRGGGACALAMRMPENSDQSVYQGIPDLVSGWERPSRLTRPGSTPRAIASAAGSACRSSPCR